MTAGIKAALDAAGGRDAVREAGDAREASTGSQVDLFAAEDAAGDELLPIAPPPRRGPGRPAGARNKRTEHTAAYLLRRYTDPLEGLLALGSGDLAHTHAQLVAAARETGLPIGELTVLGLVQLKARMLEAALPYLHAKRAPENDKGEAVVPILALGTIAPGAEAVLAAGGAVSILDLVPNEQNQWVSGGDVAGSHDEGEGDAS